MGLFTDGPAATVEGLREYESSILEVAASEGIDLAVKLKVAHREAGIDLQRLLEEHSGATLGNVVVTAPLEAWEAFRALVLTFRDAYHNQMNDRYEAKWKEYERRVQRAADALFQLGIGVTWTPVPKAASPQLSSAAGPLAAATYRVCASWTSGSEEGSPSEAALLSAPEGSSLVVRAAQAPAGVDGWNVYAGHAAGEMTLQNDAPMAPGATWTIPETGLRQGRAPGTGQAPQAMLKRTFRF